VRLFGDRILGAVLTFPCGCRTEVWLSLLEHEDRPPLTNRKGTGCLFRSNLDFRDFTPDLRALEARERQWPLSGRSPPGAGNFFGDFFARLECGR
jgi:hypothetical protein